MEKILITVPRRIVWQITKLAISLCICIALSVALMIAFNVLFDEFVWYSSSNYAVIAHPFIESYETIEALISIFFGGVVFLISLTLTVKKVKTLFKNLLKISRTKKLVWLMIISFMVPFALAGINRLYFLEKSLDYYERTSP